jgi:hypothetical protein
MEPFLWALPTGAHDDFPPDPLPFRHAPRSGANWESPSHPRGPGAFPDRSRRFAFRKAGPARDSANVSEIHAAVFLTVFYVNMRVTHPC